LKLDCYYNKKKLWIRNNIAENKYIEIDNKLCELDCSKSINIKIVDDSYLYISDEIKLSVSINKARLILNVNSDLNFTKIRLMNKQYENEIFLYKRSESEYAIPLKSIEQLEMHSYESIHLINGQNAYLAIFNNKHDFNLNSMNLLVYKSTFNIHHKVFNVNDILIRETPDKSGFIVNFQESENNKIEKHLNIVMTDNEDEVLSKYPLTYNGQKLTCKIPYDVFVDNRIGKKLYVEAIERNTNRKVIFSISENNKSKVIYRTPLSVRNEFYYIEFISKKGMFVNYKKPFLKNGINYINDRSINFFVKADDIYSHCTFSLSYEDRYSKETIEYCIDPGETEIEIDYNQIETIISKPKTVIDLFITIREQNNLVRREKIRFRTKEYKKDNYFSRKNIKNHDGNVYYLSTITPFKNIKLERFSISNKQHELMSNNEKDDNIWLIGERFDTAQDNGIIFFDWLRNNTNVDAYYVIDEDSIDYEQIKNKKNVIKFGSLKHYEIASKAKVLVSTHDFENILPYKPAKGFYGYEDTFKVFLQHGVLGRKSVEYHKFHYELPFDMFNVSSSSEKYDVVVNELGYDEENVYITGLSRFDKLPIKSNDNSIKKILIMPTWRDWLNSDFAFENSEYLERYLNLIKNPKLNKLIEHQGVEVNFYPHYRSQNYFKLYLMSNELKVQYVELGQKTVQSLLIEHDLLITDYSSVSFDFTYMNKPVIFYHFDVERFFRKGILRPIHETFLGDIVYEEKNLIERINNAVMNNDDHNLNIDKKHIFDFNDKNNNERIYQSILSNLEK
ncbi:CDP-glycerol glycerophosphotransferase family protein, partial [Mammaliicoccus stepanovicii]